MTFVEKVLRILTKNDEDCIIFVENDRKFIERIAKFRQENTCDTGEITVKGTRLFLLEKLFLYIRGRSDANNDAFQYYEEAKVFDRDNSEQPQIVVSSFIMTELCSFNTKRDAMLSKSLCILRGSENKCVRLMKFSKAIAKIDKMIAKLEGKRIGLFQVYEEEKEQLEKLIEENKTKGAKHMEKLYEKRLSILSETHNRNLVENNTKIVELLIEKIRLMEVLKVKLIAIRSRKFLRIQYYYSKARTIATRLPIKVLTENELIKIGQSCALGRYEIVLRNAGDIRDEMMNGKTQESEHQEDALPEDIKQSEVLCEVVSQEV